MVRYRPRSSRLEESGSIENPLFSRREYVSTCGIRRRGVFSECREESQSPECESFHEVVPDRRVYPSCASVPGSPVCSYLQEFMLTMEAWAITFKSARRPAPPAGSRPRVLFGTLL